MADLNKTPAGAKKMEFDLESAFLVWEVPEFPKHDRSWKWYALASAAAVGLLIYAVVSGNFTFALVIVMAAVLLYLRVAVAGESLVVAFMPEGIVYGQSFWPYKSFRSFWICYDPPQVQSLYLEFYRGLSPRLSISIDGVDPQLVRQVVGTFVKEEPEHLGEPATDLVTRLLKL